MTTSNKMPSRYGLVCIIALGIAALIPGCITRSGEKGVDNLWRSPETPAWEVGTTTDQEVLEKLGPPSQIIGLENGNVYYYMQEISHGKAYYFLIWNRSDETVRYDRAIFFFDRKGVLTEFAYSPDGG